MSSLAATVNPCSVAAISHSDASVFGAPQSAFHSQNWLRVLEDSYGFVHCCFPTTDRNVPMMEVNSRITGLRGISLPFTDESISDDVSVAPIFERAIERARSRNWKYVEVRGGRWGVSSAECGVPSSEFRVLSSEKGTPSCSFYGHTLDLTRGEAALLANLDSSVRRAIRKAEKAGIRVEIGDGLQLMKVYYALHCKTRRKHGLPPQPWLFFTNIHRQMIAEGLGIVVLAYVGPTKVAAAGAIFLHAKTEAVYKFGGSDEQLQSLRPNNLVMWEAIKWYAARGFSILRFGRTDTDHEGLRRFKLQWGTVEYPVRYWRYDLRKDTFVTQEHGVSGWHNSVFRIMPSPLSRLIGSLLYRHIA